MDYEHEMFPHTMNMVISALSIPIGLSNTIKSVKMLRCENAFIYQLNLAQSFILLFVIFFAAISYYLSTMLIEAILITKAYYANMRSKLIMGTGVLIELGRLCIHIFILIHIQATYTTLGSCFSFGTNTLFTFLVATEGCLVIFLTTAFICGLWRISREQSSGIYYSLIKDGLIYLLGICLVISIIILLIATDVAPPINGYFLDFGWLVFQGATSSQLITEQLYESHRRRKKRSDRMSRSHINSGQDFLSDRLYE
ncbi:hypothetical protein K493DRAFT_297854 [Basidiobolus meristosporus CBS 931.73]|uniref:Uncharacterized protein n=1 Tax=Basidiobolus meristosporus CBS 931.73 TaxID=1314790 RepID=A0A1Y1YY54_9FUNG|nr:hypothetical protein K493DRAFT_297854 [Basidiobolus meristosporus CBS 931.73]|eukprot:ORY02647.1 hypothetical protein K493DRAFT_297854 [Basidiobolus meristosporus CBS 931.73]